MVDAELPVSEILRSAGWHHGADRPVVSGRILAQVDDPALGDRKIAVRIQDEEGAAEVG